MALPFFYEEHLPVNTSSFSLSEDTSKHCIQVLRMKAGEQLGLTDGNGRVVTAAILKEDKKACTVNFLDEKTVDKPVRRISVGMSLLKNAARFEWFLEKATEMGVAEITPLLCTRTEKQHFRYDRMNGIIISAMLQSQQAWLPVLKEPMLLNACVNAASQQQKLIAHCFDEPKLPLGNFKVTGDVLILIGPEGDFTKQEVDDCLAKGFEAVSLGLTRLRTETAGIVASALLVNN